MTFIARGLFVAIWSWGKVEVKKPTPPPIEEVYKVVNKYSEKLSGVYPIYPGKMWFCEANKTFLIEDIQDARRKVKITEESLDDFIRSRLPGRFM